MTTKLFSLFAAVALTASLTACGGGGGSDAPAPAPTPIASAPVPAPPASAPAPTPPAPVRVAIYDAGFQKALAAQGVTVASDGTIDSAAAATVTTIDIEQDYGITDLTGISAFTNLTKLNVWYNASLTNVSDVSKLTNLNWLAIYQGAFTSIDVSKLTGLQLLGVTSIVGLNTVDTSTLTSLTELDLQNNCDDPASPWGKTQGLTSIDISHNVNLQYLHADCNLLTSIDTSKNAQLAEAWMAGNTHIVSLDFSSNHMLETVTAYAMPNLVTLNLRGTNGGQLMNHLAAWSDRSLTTIMVSNPTLYTNWMTGANQATEVQDDLTEDVMYTTAAKTTTLWIPVGVLFTQ